MSAQSDVAYLRAELAELERLIAACTPEEELTLLGFQARRDEVELELREAERRKTSVAQASLTFKGVPVFGSKGIDAEFAGGALDLFQKLVAKTSASLAGRTLGTRGPIPKVDQARLLVTGTALGSFGFVLEEAATSLFGPTPLAQALDETVQLVEAARDDELFGDAVADADPQVIEALAKFIGHVASHQATLRIHTETRDTAMLDPEEIAAAAGRTSTVRDEADTPITGVLEGLLPNTRRFEFRDESGTLIVGRISNDVLETESFKVYLDKRCVAHMRIITFQRPGRELRHYELRNVSPVTVD